MKIEIQPGTSLLEALQDAADVADREHEVVTFDFNDVEHEVLPWESEESRKARAEERCGFPILTREEAAEKARAEMEATSAKWAADIAAAGAMTERQMRDAQVPRPKSEEELAAYIRSLVDRPHDYGTCVYAMSMAAVAAFYYVSSKLGVSGFQASCADMDILRRTRGMDQGFQIINYADALYPQYWRDEKGAVFQSLMRDPDTRQRFREEAQKRLAEHGRAHPDVVAHWEKLAAG